MHTLIDWLSFTVTLPSKRGSDERDTEREIINALHALDDRLPYALGLSNMEKRQKGRPPYAVAWQSNNGGIAIMYHVDLNHALIEISGKGCEFLVDTGALGIVLQSAKNRVTRLDIACDMLTDTTVMEFAENRDLKRFKSKSFITSESGDTFYVGSRSSETYARVYRYNAPHERSKFLRVEYVLKSDVAKAAIPALLKYGTRSVAANFGERFGWKHTDWLPEATETAELEIYRPDRHVGKTLFWLTETIAPMLVRLHDEGVINVEQWFYENVKEKL